MATVDGEANQANVSNASDPSRKYAKSKQAYDPMEDDFDLDDEEEEDCVVTQMGLYQDAVGLFGNPMAKRQRKTRSPGKGPSSSTTPREPPPKKVSYKKIHELIDEEEDDEEIEEEIGESEDEEEDVVLGVDDDYEDSE
ncbi:hypothetical protein E3N88_28115 [Mikania micrantha]|uniref:Uncharacterized protein n=1 Tax=Mikania micrantha TaxID=192012 RepID=A0A5N6N072_9ASTR|nr:hypothetical protein E3N88_28115 [Mikania micrantha]